MPSRGPTITTAFRRASAKGSARWMTRVTRNIDDLKRQAELIFNDPEKLEKIENLCRLLLRRFEGAT